MVWIHDYASIVLQLHGVRVKPNNLLWYITQKTAIDYESYLGSDSFTD